MNCAGCVSAKRLECMTLGAAIGAASTRPLATVALAANAAMIARRKSSLPMASSPIGACSKSLEHFPEKWTPISGLPTLTVIGSSGHAACLRTDGQLANLRRRLWKRAVLLQLVADRPQRRVGGTHLDCQASEG